MKKLVFLLLAVILFTACGKNAEASTELDYTNIKEFGGILDWPYEVE